ncbi:phenazine-specific anthranilate synthase component I [Streptomyces spiroverticillatus]|uniref:anthranilate synthase n=1 Tax=Streptomyces finlayi TaxID=67296 RepID=A0A918X4G2_9ACTN|nr:anthranilate synthase family protein [Streptomyces finlayi]GHA31745.1 phenazine-specific anthranilate synthase component I [Streptomyces spiroverticillatus]GHD10917.1 phenazine-specific anthranilate synthase component I [Streptomyces finlayi]
MTHTGLTELADLTGLTDPAVHPLLAQVLGDDAPPFALLHRPGATGTDTVDLLVGRVGTYDLIADIPLTGTAPDRHEVLALLPYRQIRERGFACPDDGAPLLTLAVDEQAVLPLDRVLAQLPDLPIDMDEGGFDTDDEEYARRVRRVLTEEIGTGAGANFVLKRTFSAQIHGWSSRTALSFFRRLAGRAAGCHWSFVVHTGGRTFVGASPERHVSLDAGQVVMNPISGTYRYPPGGPDRDELLAFLADPKEANELYMVLDEELKMMGRICDLGGRVTGPALKEMGRLAHTEYLVEGHSSLDIREILRETLLAPTVTGGPLESACEVISRHEPEGRGHYAGVAALIGRDAAGLRRMDSAILIRTAEIDGAGRVRIPVGATLVRDSDPAGEAAETRAKAAGLIEALRAPVGTPAAPAGEGARPLSADPAVRAALAARNVPLSGFWFERPGERSRPLAGLIGRRVLVIDAEDTFTAMARHLLQAQGPYVEIRRYDEEFRVEDYDVVIVGPGPGDPAKTSDPKIARLRAVTAHLLSSGIPFLSVCLGHQVLSTLLGLPLVRHRVPSQGMQRTVDCFGRSEPVGFYNTFAARSDADLIECPGRDGTVRVFREPDGEVHALRGPGFASVQFHPASVLTQRGPELLGELIADLLGEVTGLYRGAVALDPIPA